MQWSFFAGLAINGHMPYCLPFHWWKIPRKSYYCSTGSVELIHTMKIDPLRIAEGVSAGQKDTCGQLNGREDRMVRPKTQEVLRLGWSEELKSDEAQSKSFDVVGIQGSVRSNLLLASLASQPRPCALIPQEMSL